MTNTLVNYLLESSLCLLLFVATYRLLISNLTHFSWMRCYLLVSTALSLILPFIIIPTEWSAKFIPINSFPNSFLIQAKQVAVTAVTSDLTSIHTNPEISTLEMILLIAFTVYIIGVLHKSYLFTRKLIKIHDLIKKSSKVKDGNTWIVSLKSEMPAFSFFNYIFINEAYKDLSSDELEVIKRHEMVHVKHYHTLDVLFVEIVGILFWFNPIVNYLKTSLKEIHEYIVDERIAGHSENKKAYAQLLLNLASETQVVDLVASFAGQQIKRRILMIAKPRTSPKHKLLFVILIPLTAMMLVSFSYLKAPKTNSKMHNEVIGSRLELKKYCGVYFPSEKYANYLKPIEILFRDNKLFIAAEGGSTNRMVELHFEADNEWNRESLFSYADNGARNIDFVLDSKKDVTGCGLTRFVTRRDANNTYTYLLLEGEYLKRKSGKLEE